MATHQYHLNIDTQSTISAYCVPPVARRRGGDTVRPIVRSCAFRPFVTKKTARDFSPPINQPTNQPPATIQPTTSTLSVSAPMCAPARRRTVVGQRHDFVLYAQSAKQLYLINSSKTTIISGGIFFKSILYIGNNFTRNFSNRFMFNRACSKYNCAIGQHNFHLLIYLHTPCFI